MNYQQLIQKLFNVNLFGGMKLGLNNCLRLDEILHYPSKAFPAIHVAGTNGKGSVTHKIASAYQHAGYRVGLFTSPHISCFRERIRINGVMIPENDVEQLLSKLFSAAETHQITPTFFEYTTLLAFLYFAQEKVDVAVLEVGLGGRLDATNIITPLLSVITSISLEHTEILGDTVEKIAMEKAGIIKPHVPVVLGPRLPKQLLQQLCIEHHSPYIQVTGSFASYDEENQAIAKAALEELSIPVSAIEEGLKVRPHCRFEVFVRSQLPKFQERAFPDEIILDVAHNADGLTNLFKAVRIKYGNRPLRVLFGLSKTKDIPLCLVILNENAANFHVVEAQNGRGVPAKEIKELLFGEGTRAGEQFSEERICIDSTITESLHHAIREAASQNQILIVCGTFFIMGEVRQALGLNEPQDPIDMNERK
jgi:dihydrofolate synthase/folylpolyglutamate synthase